jgi:hypothetical protein
MLRIATAASLLLCSALCAPAQAATLLEKNFWLSGPRFDAVMPTCDDPAPLAKIADRFQEKESKFWNSALQIVTFEDVREISFRPWAVDTIPRRWCSGKVLTSDGKKRSVSYSIGEDTGMIGASWGVEWCVTGLDRNWAFSPACRMARP